MSFDDDEASVEDNQPVELIDIALPTIVYRHTSGVKDRRDGAFVYTAVPLERTDQLISLDSDTKDLMISLPVTHPFVERWLEQGVPPRRVTITIRRKQLRSGEIRRVWSGQVQSVSADGQVAKVRIPAKSADTFKRKLPTITIGRTCGHMLFDNQCRLDRDAFKVVTTVAGVFNGRDVRVDIGDVNKLNGWASNGMLIHQATGEPMAIFQQTNFSGTQVTLHMQLQLPGLKAFDTVEVYAGCDKSIATCNGKFNNKDNFGGFPQLPSKNPFDPGGSGVGGQ